MNITLRLCPALPTKRGKDMTNHAEHEGASGFTADITRRARWARDHNSGRPEPAWSTGERLAVALILGDQATLDAEGYTPQEAAQRLAGDLTFFGYPADVDAWLKRVRTDLAAAPTGHLIQPAAQGDQDG